MRSSIGSPMLPGICERALFWVFICRCSSLSWASVVSKVTGARNKAGRIGDRPNKSSKGELPVTLLLLMFTANKAWLKYWSQWVQSLCIIFANFETSIWFVFSISPFALHSIGLGEVSGRPASSLSSARWCGQLVVPGAGIELGQAISRLYVHHCVPMPSAVTPGVHIFVAGSQHSRHTRDSLGTTFKAYSAFYFPHLRIALAKRFLSTSSLTSCTRPSGSTRSPLSRTSRGMSNWRWKIAVYKITRFLSR